MNKINLALCLLMSPAPVFADTWLNLGGVSHHFATSWDTGEKYNQANFGIGIEREMGGLNYVAGVYKNSHFRPSKYLIAEKIVYHNGAFGIGFLGGMVDGYQLNDGGFIPAAALTATIEHNGFGARFMFMPGIANVAAPVVSVQFRVLISP